MNSEKKKSRPGNLSDHIAKYLQHIRACLIAEQEELQLDGPVGSECWYWFPPISAWRKQQSYSLKTGQKDERPSNCMQQYADPTSFAPPRTD